jgi:hypothetical protein
MSKGEVLQVVSEIVGCFDLSFYNFSSWSLDELSVGGDNEREREKQREREREREAGEGRKVEDDRDEGGKGKESN